MDLNTLLQRQQEERIRAWSAKCDASRRAHLDLAIQFEDAIRQLTEGRLDIARA